MQTVKTVAALRAAIRACRLAGQTVAFVPTMGNLHAGHLALVARAREQADCVVVSIFVNPAQFGPNEDFARYPRTEAADADQLTAHDTDVLFLPSVQEVYGNHPQPTRVSVPGLSEILCGAGRPGHFDGVATVVARLFNMVQPDVAVFGEKDYQQITLIRRMVAELAIPVQIEAVATQRERDGLAMSSRNQYLTDSERKNAPELHAGMVLAVAEARQKGAPFKKINSDLRHHLISFGFKPEYVEIRRQSDLGLPEAGDTSLVLLVAARLGETRLIDNIPFESS